MPRILVVDDDQGHRAMLRATLRAEGYEAVVAEDGQVGVDAVELQVVDLVLLVLRMPRMDGMTALSHLRERNPALPVLIMTAYGSVDTAVDALKAGAYDYVQKPFDPENLQHLIEKASERHQLVTENRQLRQRLDVIARRTGVEAQIAQPEGVEPAVDLPPVPPEVACAGTY